jgi:hypothetical protein
MTYYEKINILVSEFFGLLTFEELELIFNEKLIGLPEEETESKIDWMRTEWFEMEWEEAMSIIQQFDKQIN